MSRLESHENVACGGGPVVAVMKAARSLGADRATVLRYADSGDAGGGKGQVVGYLSAALTAP
jgi:AmmeMemoRadiSam system protein B